MRSIGLLAWIGMVPLWAGEMPEKAAEYHAALAKRPESLALFQRFRDAWLEERSAEELEGELLSRAEAGEAAAWALLGRARLAAGREEAAIEAFGKAREQLPAAWLDLEMAKLRLATKDFPAAEKAALAVPENDPQRPEALKLAGLACLRGERVEEALAFWAKAVAAAPGDKGLLEDLTELTRREGRFDLALEFCGKWRDATEDAYGKAMATLRRSELLLGSQRFEEAMTELAAVLKVSADSSWLELETIARAEQAYRQQGNTTGWAKWIGGQSEENPTRLNFQKVLAQALAASGKVDEALEVLADVLKRSPGDMAARWQRVDFLVQSMKLGPAFDECKRLADDEKSESSGLRLAELAFRLEKKDEVKRALDAVLAVADPARRVGLAGLYARYGQPEESEKAWRGAVDGEDGGQALRELAKHLRSLGRERDAVEVWKKLGARDVPGDQIEAAQMLAAVGERASARNILEMGREKFSAEPGYEAARAELALMEGKPDEARAVFLAMARAARRPDELAIASKGWLRAVAKSTEPLKDLGENTADRCLRATWLAESDKVLPAVLEGDELERSMRLTLLREHGKWPDVVAMMEAQAGGRGPLFLSELAEAKTAAGDHYGALKSARIWRETTPDQPGPWLREADILEKLGQGKEATVLLRRASARFEDNEDVARRLFSLLQAIADPREAMEWAWKRHDRSEDEAARSTWLREILRVFKERKQLDDLKERFEERARRDPASPGPLVALAELAKARGDSRAELDFLRRAAVNAPRDVAIVSAIATLEERSGESELALERHASLARLVPGPDSARQLAQAKIRLGDIEGGMRDLQLLAGDKGIDLRELEQSANDLASRGYVEEAIRMLEAVDPALRDARLYYVLGLLLEADGREREALDAFIKVMEEPEDPAEKQLTIFNSYRQPNQMDDCLSILQNQVRSDNRRPGNFSGMELPDSLVAAKAGLKIRLARQAIQHGGEIWTQVSALVPAMNMATPEQWRTALGFTWASGNGNGAGWWQFIETHPDNPLGIEMLARTGQISGGKPEQTDALLKHNPPPRIQMLMRAGQVWRPDTLVFLESLDEATWKDATCRQQALRIVEWMFAMACSADPKTPVTIAECSRALALLEKPGFEGLAPRSLDLLKINMALLEGETDEIVLLLNAWGMTGLKESLWRLYHQPGSQYPRAAFAAWRKKAGDKAAEALIARIDSPTLRCLLSSQLEPKQRMAMIERELSALPAGAQAGERRALIRLKWSIREGGQAIGEAMRKELLEYAANDADPRMALEANMQLNYFTSDNRELNRPRIETLIQRLSASSDPDDQAYAAQFGGWFGRNNSQASRPVTRWGSSTRFSNSSNYGRSQGNLAAILAMDDRDQATREAAKLLESTSRSSSGRAENLRGSVKQLSEAGLLEGALARISLPPNAGLVRRVSMIALLDACGKPEPARSQVQEIAKARPAETLWTVDLALRTPDDAEMHRLLDSVAGREDFDLLMASNLEADMREKSDQIIELLLRVADWADKTKGSHLWMNPVMVNLAGGGRSGMSAPGKKNERQLECYRRYVKLALDDRGLAELGFRVMSGAGAVETPESITDAARRVLLVGAYASDERTLIPALMQGLANPPEASSSLEHLVIVARELGDAVAFPSEFLATLKTVDPVTETWIGKMLAAKTVAELPDLTIEPSGSPNWVAMARHEAAVCRAVNLPGRDAWITGIFHDKKYQYRSRNFSQVVSHSLRDAAKTKTMPKLVIGWLEAAGGPRKSWLKMDQTTRHVPEAAASILDTSAKTDAETLLAVLGIFREARVPVNEPRSGFNQLSQWWQMEMKPPRKATLAELLGPKRDATLTLGTWNISNQPDGRMIFNWALPQLLRELRSDEQRDRISKVKDMPDASFLDLMQAWTGTGDRTLQRRALIKVIPDLAKLPAEIRRAVLDALTAGMGPQDMKGLPGPASERLRERIAGERSQRLKMARMNLEEMKKKPTGYANQGSEFGSLLGTVIIDDDALVTEVLAAWRPVAEADKSGKEIAAFAGSLVSAASRHPQAMMPVLRLLDSLWQGAPPPTNRNSGFGDPMQNIWNSMGRRSLTDPDLWRQVSTLSPKLQAQFWLHSLGDVESAFGADPKLVKTLREAAKGSDITRTALEWRLQQAVMLRDRKVRIDGATLLAFAKALKNAGSPAENIAIPLGRAYQWLSRFENPAALMAETPVLLEGLKSFVDDDGRGMLQGIGSLWEMARREQNKANNDYSGKIPQVPLHPVETAALMKFVFSRNTGIQQRNYPFGNMTYIVLAIDDPELLEIWIKVGGQSIIGDSALIMRLLETDRIANALALTPPAGQSFSSLPAYNAHIESLVAKLHKDPSPRAFVLASRLSMSRDASGAEAPAEKYEDRLRRLIEDFERVRGGLPVADRAGFCQLLGLTRRATTEHVPALDEFADEAAMSAFRKMLVSGNSESPATELIIPAVCSRIHAGDLSGLTRLTAALIAVPTRSESNARLFSLRPIQSCLIAHANRFDAKLPEDSVTAILGYAKALAGFKNPELRSLATQLVYLAATDAASLEAGLRQCELETMNPTAHPDYSRSGMGDAGTQQMLMRVALLHPVSSETLLATLITPEDYRPSADVMLPLLRDPKLRARVSPALFLQWNRPLRRVTPEQMDALKLYVAERRSDFDEPQLPILDEMMKRLENPPKSVNPPIRDEMLRRQQDEMRRRYEEMMRRKPER